MFDTCKVANNIKVARTKKNMTQMNLADEMGVSYQAVSNWERGNSMPDISRLQELCTILEISFEDLVDEKNQETKIVEKLMLNKEDVTVEEIVQVAPLVKPDKIEKKINEAINNDVEISFSTLIGLAPFLDKKSLDELANKVSNIDIGKLIGLAPFLSKKTLDVIVNKAIEEDNLDTNRIVGLAPFLSKETIKKIIDYMIQHGQENRIIAIVPFMGTKAMSNIVGKAAFNNEKNICEKDDSLTKFDNLAEEEVADILSALEKIENVEEYLEHMNEDDIARIASKALDLGADVEIFLDYMDEDDIARLASKALDLGSNVEMFLDYMDEDDIETLASMSLADGKSIEIYFDYLGDDAIKNLLIMATKK